MTETADNRPEVSGTEELRELFRRMPVALYRTSPSGTLLAANTALANLLGYQTIEEMRAAMADVGTAYVNRRQRAAWIEEIDEAGIVYDFDVELIRADGSTVWVQDTARAIRSDSGEILFYEGALIDMTEKVKAKKAKDEFVATVSHELRNPIAVVLGLGEELANRYDSFDDKDRREMARLIARQADEASWLIEDLLVAYRDDVGRVPVSIQAFDIIKEAERVLEVVDTPIAVQVAGEHTRVMADPRRSRQIIRNLITNSIRYGGDNIFVRIEPIGDRVELSVCDTGDPIPPQEVERIFRAFETGTSSHHPKSVGLGLSVARRLARLMEGDLTYRHQNGLSTFVLSLPSA